MGIKFNQINFLFFLLLFSTFIGCSGTPKKASRTETMEEIRLRGDREKLDKLRKDLPRETKEYNDETAFILELFADETKTPQQISSKFHELSNKKRTEFSKKERRLRADYRDSEKKKREDFLSRLKKERGSVNLAKMSPENRNRFISDQDTERKKFFADEREARNEFESNLHAERNDFEAHMKDMRSRFDAEYRNYSRNFDERRKKKNEQDLQKKKVSAVPPQPTQKIPAGFSEGDIKDLESIPKTAQPLEPTEN